MFLRSPELELVALSIPFLASVFAARPDLRVVWTITWRTPTVALGGFSPGLATTRSDDGG